MRINNQTFITSISLASFINMIIFVSLNDIGLSVGNFIFVAGSLMIYRILDDY